ncbi:hypothetical protein OQA88_12940 [Cercophora sp. LCS_1]
MASIAPYLNDPPSVDERAAFELVRHGHQDLVQAVAFNAYGDRCATGSVDGKIRVFNRHKDAVWRHCDSWGAHGGEILELQWLPPTIYPNLVASLGIEGRFKLWAEDPSAAPGRRFSNRTSSQKHSSDSPTPGGSGSGGANPKAAFETRSTKSQYRSFSMKYLDDTRHTYLALLAADGTLTVYENETPEDLTDWTRMDELSVCQRPPRGEETSFRVRFDPNPDVCYSALRAGVPTDALGLVVAAMDGVRIYRTRDVASASLGVTTTVREFYLAAAIEGHRGLVRDVAWAPGNIRGYDVIATACMDGWVRVFRLDTPMGGEATEDGEDGEDEEEREAVGWGAAEIKKHSKRLQAHSVGEEGSRGAASGIRAGFDQLRTGGERRMGAGPAQVRHVVTEVSRLDSHRTPVWRVGFDDDGQILGSVGDEGKLMCYRQTPDGRWARSSELAMMKMKMAAP